MQNDTLNPDMRFNAITAAIADADSQTQATLLNVGATKKKQSEQKLAMK
jgi:hypothetical protein